MKGKILRVWRGFLGLLYPLDCYVCGARIDENCGLCAGCMDKIHKNETGVSACRYEGALKQAIHLFKYRGFMAILKSLSGLLLDFVDRSVDMRRVDAIVPVPLAPVKLRERGFNQAYLLARPVSSKYNIPLLTKNLIRTKSTKSQSRLKRLARIKNLKDSFAVKNPDKIRGKNLLIIDDVYTTGATINSAASALKSAGAASVRQLTLARGI